eukprot:3539113-Pleurochrysis_carterae.AAC.1
MRAPPRPYIATTLARVHCPPPLPLKPPLVVTPHPLLSFLAHAAPLALVLILRRDPRPLTPSCRAPRPFYAPIPRPSSLFCPLFPSILGFLDRPRLFITCLTSLFASPICNLVLSTVCRLSTVWAIETA